MELNYDTCYLSRAIPEIILETHNNDNTKNKGEINMQDKEKKRIIELEISDEDLAKISGGTGSFAPEEPITAQLIIKYPPNP